MKVQGNGLNNWDTGASAHTTRMGGGQMPPLEKYLWVFPQCRLTDPPALEFYTALPGDRARSTDKESPRLLGSRTFGAKVIAI